MEFNRYQHVERFGNEEVDGIDIGTCYIFPKIDGTNVSVWVEDCEDGWKKIQSGSRNRVLDEEKDNAGFCKWVNIQITFPEFFKRYPTFKLYGEWLVPHSLKTYREDAWRKFYVFDVVEKTEEGDFRYLTDGLVSNSASVLS